MNNWVNQQQARVKNRKSVPNYTEKIHVITFDPTPFKNHGCSLMFKNRRNKLFVTNVYPGQTVFKVFLPNTAINAFYQTVSIYSYFITRIAFRTNKHRRNLTQGKPYTDNEQVYKKYASQRAANELYSVPFQPTSCLTKTTTSFVIVARMYIHNESVCFCKG